MELTAANPPFQVISFPLAIGRSWTQHPCGHLHCELVLEAEGLQDLQLQPKGSVHRAAPSQSVALLLLSEHSLNLSCSSHLDQSIDYNL